MRLLKTVVTYSPQVQELLLSEMTETLLKSRDKLLTFWRVPADVLVTCVAVTTLVNSR